ncbi:MAG: 2Fe-2S iron-sulfur cluster binding domain-containing protein [gamma proteobacterium symbiont of Lucinoma myriamae]|nr:2Fe-2S iron-sulfur cluster binding domain-containing protein [gamma proteobacterium symbiont of Lucinoma myriamae]MCU7819856.1 2Fe-2S iron-sulfur cluster binding domain-containing protein [gamma proteobacterium symbiont of Lucinoma myriamae]MCU7832446.1 2Fe-2S iron-sulfur cluster binding domain-containing protein [gamma proteobacterium symbiont of Lucinoma myriamae]
MLHSVDTASKCGGKAICGCCRVKILSGHKYCNKPVSEERVILNKQELKQGWRLSCQLYCLRDVTIFIP